MNETTNGTPAAENPPKPLEELVHPEWAEVLAPQRDLLTHMGVFLREELAAGHQYHPAGSNILAAFRRPLSQVKVLIVGQDPYPTPGHAMGLSFSVAPHVSPIPKSLVNIYQELSNDLGIPPVRHGDLRSWADQGVLLLNRVLTVRSGQAGSHRGQGWEEFTQAAITALVDRNQPLVAILWGKDAQGCQSLLGDRVPSVMSPHPSPLSAHRGFFGSRPFSRSNELLVKQGGTEVDWRLPETPGPADSN